MTDAKPKILLDFEFHFTDGEIAFIGIEEGRDSVNADTGAITVQLDEHTTEYYELNRHNLNFTKTTRREVQPEPHGTIQ